MKIGMLLLTVLVLGLSACKSSEETQVEEVSVPPPAETMAPEPLPEPGPEMPK